MPECLVHNEIDRIEQETRWALTKNYRSTDVDLLNAQIALDARRVLRYHMAHCSVCQQNDQEKLKIFASNEHKRVDRIFA